MRYEFQDYYLHKHQYDVYRFLSQEFKDPTLLNFIAEKCEEFPDLTLQLALNSKLPNTTKHEKITKLFLSNHNFFGIVGAVGGGKTSLNYFFNTLTLQHQTKKIYWVGSMNPKKVPSFAQHVYCDSQLVKKLAKENKSIFDAFDKKSIVYFDELSHIFPKGSITQEDLERLTIYRHKDLVVIGATQNSSIISIDVLRFFTGIFILQTTLFHTENERENPLFQAINLFRPKKAGECLFYSAVLGNEFFLKFNYPYLSSYKNYEKGFS